MEDGETTAPLATDQSQHAAAPTVSAPSADRDRRDAVAQLFKAHGEAVFGYCVRMLRDPVLAEDLMQQVFLEAHRDFDRFRGQSSRRTWLFGIATHRCLDALKRRRAAVARIEPTEGRDEQLDLREPEAPGRGPFEHLDHAQLLAALDACLTTLSGEVRATVLMRFYTGMTYDQMEPYLEASADALQMRVSRSMPVLRRCLETKGWTGE